MKIIYFIDSIFDIGGIERVVKIKAQYLSNITEFEIKIITCDDENKINKNIINNIEIIGLNINIKDKIPKRYFFYILSLLKKKFIYYQKLKKTIRKIKPDILISTGLFEKYPVLFIKGDIKKIREFHFDRIHDRINENKLKYLILNKLCNYIDRNFLLKKFNKIVVLTKEDKINNWSNNEQILIINNPLTISSTKYSNLMNKKMIAIGRLENQKNFSSLIRAYKIVVEKHPDWILEIWGEGSLKNHLQNEIRNLNLKENIILKGTTDNLNEIYGNASLLLMTSKYEGWGLVLTEAMSYGIPVISYDCPCGPKEIIEDGINGFLIPQGKENILAEKICFFIENPEILKDFGKKALESTKRYDIDKIMNKWIELFKEITK